jgi:hypothetical protein
LLWQRLWGITPPIYVKLPHLLRGLFKSEIANFNLHSEICSASTHSSQRKSAIKTPS